MRLDKLAAAFGDEHVEVIEGTLLVGTGDRLDPKMTQALAVGDSATAPAG